MAITPPAPSPLAPSDWVTRAVDTLLRGQAPAGPILLASGISPSGPIHLGNLREVLTPHFLLLELQRRGIPAEHLLSWDDYDRFRRVPAGVPGVTAEWEAYLGRPLSEVPPPHGSSASSWGDHFKELFREALSALGIEVTEVSQSERYQAGAYQKEVLHALDARQEIAEVLREHQTLGEKLTPETYYPYRPYCGTCGTDATTVEAWDPARTLLTFTCSCGASEERDLSRDFRGKLAWKVDWPMRWAFYGVSFEAAGADHRAPGSSWAVGEALAPIFGGSRPAGLGYSFVGSPEGAKLTSSRGGALTPADALAIMPASTLRWLYARRRPEQALSLDFSEGHLRLMDEWDAFCRKVAGGRGKPADQAAHLWATALGTLPEETFAVPYRALSSSMEVTGNQDKGLRQALALGGYEPSLEALAPRREQALAWLERHAPEEVRLIPRETPNLALLPLSRGARLELAVLLEDLSEGLSQEALTRLVFGIPKVIRGYSPEETEIPPEVKAAQREFFELLYQALLTRSSGPRLPQLIPLLGVSRVKELLRPLLEG